MAFPIAMPDPSPESDGYRCSLCFDSGFLYRKTGRAPCNCDATERFWQLESERAGVPDNWREIHLRIYEPVAGANHAAQYEAFKRVRDWARAVWDHLRKGAPHPGGMLIYGTRGPGKSYLAAAAANSLIREDIRTEWVNVPDLYLSALPGQLTEAGARGLLDGLKAPNILILDDIGAEKASEYSQTLLYSLLEDRTRRGKILLATSNHDPRERSASGGLTELESRLGERNASRLLGLCHPLCLTGEDLRLKR